MEPLASANDFNLQNAKSVRGQTFASLTTNGKKYTLGPFMAPFGASAWDKRLSLDLTVGDGFDALDGVLNESTQSLGGEWHSIVRRSSHGVRLRLKLDENTTVWDHNKEAVSLQLPEAIPMGSWVSAVVEPRAYSISGRRGVTFYCKHIMLEKGPPEACPF